MSDESLEEWIVRWLSEVLGVPVASVDPSVPFSRLGVDSMVLTGFVAELEKRTGRQIDVQMLADFPSPQELARELDCRVP